MTITSEDQYTTAYKGILTPEELAKAAREADEFAKSVPWIARVLPRDFVRKTAGNEPDKKKIGLVEKAAQNADAKGRDYSDIAAKLNYHQFILGRDGAALVQLKNAAELSAEFPKGQGNEWPILVLTANSNLTSPQSFYDSFDAAHILVPHVMGFDRRNMRVAGTYFSERNVENNAVTTIKRYAELGKKFDSLEGLTPAAEIQAYQLLDLLLDRDAKGKAVMFMETQEKNPKTGADEIVSRPVIRSDAAEVMAHVVGYGYSAAHMTNKDAFRAVRDIIAKGDVVIEKSLAELESEPLSLSGDNPKMLMRRTDVTDAEAILEHARLIGVAGMDRLQPQHESGMPREVDFISRDDFSSALNGTGFLKAPQVIVLEQPSDTTIKPKKIANGHDQMTTIRVIIDNANGAARKKANDILTTPSLFR